MENLASQQAREKIGFFDSGLGGLLVLKATVNELREYDFEYYGDTKHLPYGERSEAEIYELTKAGVTNLFNKNCAIVIIACNTASAETIRRLQDEFIPKHYPDRKILGVIVPVVEAVVEDNPRHILLVATNRTVNSRKYEMELAKLSNTNTKIDSIATPKLVPLLEEGNEVEALNLLQNLIDEHITRKPSLDSVILGCTHYDLLTEKIRLKYEPKIKIYTPTEIIPQKLASYLNRHPEVTTRLTKNRTRNIHLTENKTEYDVHILTLLDEH